MIIAIQRIDDGVSIMNVLDESLVNKALKDWQDIHVNQYVSHTIMDKNEIPSDRTFRNAWTLDNRNKIIHDINKAKEIKKNIFRELRKPILEKLDVEFIQAVEKNTSTKNIAQKKQALRDITDISLPTDIEELKNFMPDILL